jgi:hypothetical protein
MIYLFFLFINDDDYFPIFYRLSMAREGYCVESHLEYLINNSKIIMLMHTRIEIDCLMCSEYRSPTNYKKVPKVWKIKLKCRGRASVRSDACVGGPRCPPKWPNTTIRTVAPISHFAKKTKISTLTFLSTAAS